MPACQGGNPDQTSTHWSSRTHEYPHSPPGPNHSKNPPGNQGFRAVGPPSRQGFQHHASNGSQVAGARRHTGSLTPRAYSKSNVDAAPGSRSPVPARNAVPAARRLAVHHQTIHQSGGVALGRGASFEASRHVEIGRCNPESRGRDGVTEKDLQELRAGLHSYRYQVFATSLFLRSV